MEDDLNLVGSTCEDRRRGFSRAANLGHQHGAVSISCHDVVVAAGAVGLNVHSQECDLDDLALSSDDCGGVVLVIWVVGRVARRLHCARNT